MVRWAISGDRLAVGFAGGEMWIVGSDGGILFRELLAEPALPFPAADGGFYLMSGSRVLRIDPALAIMPLVDTERAFTTQAALVVNASGTLYVYTGEGRSLYAYGPGGMLLWIAFLPGSYLRPPLLGLGGGRLLYALSADGQLLAIDTVDGHLVAQLALYDGGAEGSAAARLLDVRSDDTVIFAGGFLSVVTLDGLALINGQ
jgi:outer membrane protein assembly factor BamB